MEILPPQSNNDQHNASEPPAPVQTLQACVKGHPGVDSPSLLSDRHWTGPLVRMQRPSKYNPSAQWKELSIPRHATLSRPQMHPTKVGAPICPQRPTINRHSCAANKGFHPSVQKSSSCTTLPPRQESAQSEPPTTPNSAQSRPPTTSPPSTEMIQSRPPTTSPPRTESTQSTSPARTENTQSRPSTTCPPSTKMIQSRPPTTSPPRTESTQSKPTTVAPARTENTQSRSPTTSAIIESVQSRHEGIEDTLSKLACKALKNECKTPGVITRRKSSPDTLSISQTCADPITDSPPVVCRSGHNERLVDGSAHVHCDAPQQDWENADGDSQTPATHQITSCTRLKEDDPKEGLELFITVDEESNKRRRLPGKRKKENKLEGEEPLVSCDLDKDLDQALDDRASQHNLTAVNVRNILHEVITNEHVVAMMKAAITETEGLPLFEPKMTRSKLKEVVEKGVVIPTWNLSPIKKVGKAQVPQFVDIPLEEEDSSDEEYQPEEEDEDETAEESLLESDVESIASSPHGLKRPRGQHLSESEEAAECHQSPQNVSLPGGRHIIAESVPMGPPPPPKAKHTQDSTFMEKLSAVDEELDRNPVVIDSFQSLDDSLIAFRTRSKRPLKDVPIGQLEAKLQAPDITPDMYDHNTADDEDWKMWLHGLMQDDVGNEDEGDDDDDPEYNILDDLHLEPDTEDLRNDRAVRITKKEVNQLMEELFETFQDEMGISHLEAEGPDDGNIEPLPNFNTPQAMRFEEPLANLLTEQHRTVKAKLEYLRMRKSMMKGDEERSSVPEPETPKPPPPPKAPPVMVLDVAQRKRLQQQMQQHVQLLTQLHLLTYRNSRLTVEAETAQMYLVELSSFAESSTMSHLQCPGFQSAFLPCNLREALQLIPLVHSQAPEEPEPLKPPRKNANEVLDLPKHIAWIMATRPLFMYPELLPVCAMRAPGPRDKVFFTKGEDNLLALGLMHFEGTDFQLISKYLLTAKTAKQLTARIRNLTLRKTPDNIIMHYKKTHMLPPLSRCCEDTPPQDGCPPVEREKHKLPFWIKASLSSIEAFVGKLEKDAKSADERYPLILPPTVTLTLKPLPRRFYRRSWRQKRASVLRPLLIRPSPSTVCSPKPAAKAPAAPQSLPFQIVGQVPPLILPSVPGMVNLQPVPSGRKAPQLCIPVPACRRPLQVANSSSAAVTHFPATSARVIMPATCNQRLQKSLMGGMPKRKTVHRPVGIRAPTLLQPAPVLFTLPGGGALKLVSLGAPSSILRPVSASGRVPVTAVVLNAAPAPLSQTLIPPPFCQIPVSVTPKDGHLTNQNMEESVVKSEVDECDHVIVHVKKEGSLICAMEDGTDGKMKQDGRDSGEDIGKQKKTSQDAGDVKDNVTQSDTKACVNAETKEWAGVSGQNTAHGQEAGDLQPVDMEEPEGEPEDHNPDEPQNQEYGVVADSPKNTTSTTDGDVGASSPAAAPQEASSPPDGQEGSNDKEALEEEEEEDFDDLTQDEDEMSSASEESVLSVPELQETMEKLTWLASERRLSQEGDSEENSQEENTEEEEEEEAAEGSAHKPELLTDKTGEDSDKLDPRHHCVPSPAPVETNAAATGERRRAGTKVQSSHRARNRRGRARTSKDASKLLLLYDEKILLKDPLREQKDLAYAQSYLTRVREALKAAPGTYEQFLGIIYEFETNAGKRTAVDLYESLRRLLQDWPQLLKDFAAFLLPEQALECGLFEEQQAFEKSRRFLRQLEICFLGNPTHHQKIIKLLQSCADCPLQEIGKLKTQMWQLLKGHHHLQEEFSLFFDQLRPPASRMEDFEVVNWTDKDYKFDGFEEVTLPEMEEEEEPNKVQPVQRNKRRKEPSGHDKDVEWLDGGKDCPCTCHDGGAEPRLKRCKRRLCNHCSNKACDSRSQRSLDPTGSHTAFRHSPAGDGRSPLLKMRTGHKSRSAVHMRSISGTDNTAAAHRVQAKDNGRLGLRASRRPHVLRDPMQAEKPSEVVPASHSSPSNPSSEDVIPISTLATPQCDQSAESPSSQANDGGLTMCAKNIKVSSSGEKLIVWTREADRVILTMCQEHGAHDETFAAISSQLGNKSCSEVAQRFRELVSLFQTSCVTSSEEEEEDEEEDDAGLTEENTSDAAQSEED